MPLPENIKGGAAQITVYIGQDRCLYIHELQTDCLFKIYEDINVIIPPPSPAGVPEPPADGNIYGRVNPDGWRLIFDGSTIYPFPSPLNMIDENSRPNAWFISAQNGLMPSNRGIDLDPSQLIAWGPMTLTRDANGDLIITSDDGTKTVNLTNGFAGSGSGGGVQNTGDTMTGPLVMKSDQFTYDTNAGVPVAALVIQDSQGAEVAGLALGQFGDLTITGARKGLQIHSPGFIQFYRSDGTRTFYIDDNGRLVFPPASGLGLSGNPNGDLQISSNALGSGIELSSAAAVVRFHLAADNSGDLIATQTTGPNAGKSVNLTFGKWTLT